MGKMGPSPYIVSHFSSGDYIEFEIWDEDLYDDDRVDTLVIPADQLEIAFEQLETTDADYNLFASKLIKFEATFFPAK